METLLYDSSSQNIIRKRLLREKLIFLFYLSLIIFGCIILFFGDIIFLGKFTEITWFDIYTWIFASCVMGFALYEVIRVLGLRDVKVYDTGIITPWRPFHYVLKGKEDLILFDKIKAVYLNPNLPYITIEFKDKNYYKMEALKIDKKWIYDLDKFKNVLRGRVNVIERDYIDMNYIHIVARK